ncbi:MAG: hypothetical protein AAFV62_13885, partial [Pseudomonadota bacterium]
MNVGRAEPVVRHRVMTSRYVVETVPERGASLVRMAWRHDDREWRELMRRPEASVIDDRSTSLSLLSSF